MELKSMQKLAQAIIDKLGPYCQKIEVAGSIRRKKPLVNDIDIVLIGSDLWNLRHELSTLGQRVLGGDKLERYKLYPSGVQVDIYFATSETWATLLLIRTGSKESNIRLCSRAKEMGWHLAANGDGLFDEMGRRRAGDTEESIYGALGLPYQKPEERR